ncbi:hypothetical protein ACJRO7_015037 [Eucalyptus globulus]|uniref:Uncharacterized protein n=1 Tax=Eucalyptus globulus TaxID=34317 RepID=A0ABD3LCS7_EUCGL
MARCCLVLLSTEETCIICVERKRSSDSIVLNNNTQLIPRREGKKCHAGISTKFKKKLMHSNLGRLLRCPMCSHEVGKGTSSNNFQVPNKR